MRLRARWGLPLLAAGTLAAAFAASPPGASAPSEWGRFSVLTPAGPDEPSPDVVRRLRRLVYAEHRPNGDYYYSITIPSLIVATYGGGTHLATQRECLELLGCYGSGQVRKFAEIVAATVLCGELSLGSAIVAEEWVEAHDLYGRNRP